jgi:membrane protein implicated in regulation of membrane protease activity
MTPFQLLNRFSFLIFPLLLFAAGAAVLLWRRARWPWWAGWATLLAAFLVLALTSGQRTSARYDTPENIRLALASAGQPTLVEFFSNY